MTLSGEEGTGIFSPSQCIATKHIGAGKIDFHGLSDLVEMVMWSKWGLPAFLSMAAEISTDPRWHRIGFCP